MQILAYITEDKARYLGGDPLALYIATGNVREEVLFSLAKALGGDVIQMPNGDHVIIKDQ